MGRDTFCLGQGRELGIVLVVNHFLQFLGALATFTDLSCMCVHGLGLLFWSVQSFRETSCMVGNTTHARSETVLDSTEHAID